jgi:hypothetical protein
VAARKFKFARVGDEEAGGPGNWVTDDPMFNFGFGSFL